MALLDTLIFLTALYLTLATVVSYVNEQLASILHWRGKQLYAGVLNLVCGEAPLVEALFQHPLIAASSNDKDGVIAENRTKAAPTDRVYRPSYIAARNFTLAFHELVSGATKNEQGQFIYNAGSEIITAPDALFAALQKQAEAWKGTKFGAQLNALLIQAQGDYDRLLTATDAWFNRQMDRVSGWYKRFTVPIMFAIGALLTSLGGIDTIRIISFLQADPSARSQLVNGIITSHDHTIQDSAVAQYGSFFVPGLTVGWSGDYHVVLLHIAGLIITMMAAALGAPFWFDLLSCLINVRLAGQKPSTAQNQTAGDKK